MVYRWLREKPSHTINTGHCHNGIDACMIAHVTEGMRGASGSLHPAYQYMAEILEMGYLSIVQYFSYYSVKFLMWFTAVLIIVTLAL